MNRPTCSRRPVLVAGPYGWTQAAKSGLFVHHRPTERLKLLRDVAMASIAIASFEGRRVKVGSVPATILVPTVEDHVAFPSSDPILEVSVRSGLRR